MILYLNMVILLFGFSDKINFDVIETEKEITVKYQSQEEKYKKNAILTPDIFYKSDSLIIINLQYKWDKNMKLQVFDIYCKQLNNSKIEYKKLSNVNIEQKTSSVYFILRQDNLYCLYENSVLLKQTYDISICENWIRSKLIEI